MNYSPHVETLHVKTTLKQVHRNKEAIKSQGDEQDKIHLPTVDSKASSFLHATMFNGMQFFLLSFSPREFIERVPGSTTDGPPSKALCRGVRTNLPTAAESPLFHSPRILLQVSLNFRIIQSS